MKSLDSPLAEEKLVGLDPVLFRDWLCVLISFTVLPPAI